MDYVQLTYEAKKRWNGEISMETLLGSPLAVAAHKRLAMLF